MCNYGKVWGWFEKNWPGRLQSFKVRSNGLFYRLSHFNLFFPHFRPNTECYSCCSTDECNDPTSAFKKLPKEIFNPKKEEKFITKKDLNEEEKFLKDLEMLIEQDEMKLEDEGKWFSNKSESNNATTKNFFEILNETTPTSKSETNATTVNQNATTVNQNSTTVNQNATIVAAINQTFTTTTQSLNIATLSSVHNITISTNVTSSDMKNSSIPLNSTTVTTKSLSPMTTKSINKLLIPIDTDDEPVESFPSIHEEQENFFAEHHALTANSATLTEINAFLLMITFFVISIGL